MRKTLNDLIFLGVVRETVEILGHKWTLQTITAEESLKATKASGNSSDSLQRLHEYRLELITLALKSVDDQPLDDYEETSTLIRSLQSSITDKLYFEYEKMQIEQNKSLESIEEIKN